MKALLVKRFTETEKWNDPWFRKLSPELKCFWLFVLDNCDLAGVWKVDMEIANFFICGSLTEQIVLAAMPGRFKKIDDHHWHVTKFIPFQYGELKPDCRPHQAVIRILKKHSLSKEHPKGIYTLKDKDKDKDSLGRVQGNPFLDRVRGLFNKRASTPLDAAELHAWKAARLSVEQTTEHEWQLLEWVYGQKGNDVAKYRRHDMATLLNNWNGAIDKAQQWKTDGRPGQGGYPKGWSDRQIKEYEEAQRA